MIPGDLLSAFSHRQFNTLPGLLDSWAALPNSNPNVCVPCREAVCTILMMVFGMTRPRGELVTIVEMIYDLGWGPLQDLVGWLCLTSHRQRGHLETAPPFTVLCEGLEARFLHHPQRESNPRSLRGSPLRNRCATPAPPLTRQTVKDKT